MKIAFFGTSEFGLPALDALRSSRHELLCVFSTPDKPSGRRLRTTASPVKSWALERGVEVSEYPEPLTEAFVGELRALGADVFAVIAFRHILPAQVLSIPRVAALNVHSSLLPKYRGAAPIHWAILSGENETGVSVIRMSAELDAGDVLFQRSTPIGPEEDYRALERRLADLGAEALLKTLERIESGVMRGEPQELSKVSYARKITKEDGRIAWDRPAEEIRNRIRALAAWPVCFTFYAGRRLLLHRAETIRAPFEASPGTILRASQKDGLWIACGRQALKIQTLQIEGRAALPASDFLRGFAMEEGARLE